jgi:hypothetical protein
VNDSSSFELPSHRVSLASSLVATIALGLLVALAFGNVQPSPADKATLLFLAVSALLAGWTPLSSHFEDETNGVPRRGAHNAATFFLAAALFVVYSMARNGGPEEGWSLRFAFLPDDVFVVPYSARIAVIGALIALPLGLKVLSAWTKAVWITLIILGSIALFSFRLLSGYYPVGVTETLDPTPLVQTWMQVIEYASLAFLCSSATAHPAARRWILRVLPLVLLALWARHQWGPAPQIEEDE